MDLIILQICVSKFISIIFFRFSDAEDWLKHSFFSWFLEVNLNALKTNDGKGHTFLICTLAHRQIAASDIDISVSVEVVLILNTPLHNFYKSIRIKQILILHGYI